MTTFKKQLVAAVSAGSLLLSMTSPVFAATTLEISGNGADSHSTADVQNNGTTTVVQSNDAVVTNNIKTSSNTGDNSASKNTGGDVAVRTGDASSDVKVENNLNSNQANVDCCNKGDASVLISGNGAYSKNDVKLKNDGDTSIYQDNYAKVKNNIDTDASTGNNKADKNTSGGVMVITGDARTNVEVATTANANRAMVGGNGSDAGTTSLKVMGNGADSKNKIDVYQDDDTTIVQDNWAEVKNKVNSSADTGYNSADKNTGGDVAVLTGDSETDVTVDNMVNFNWANVDCGCVTDLMAKVGGNGYDSKNDIKAKFDNDKNIFQGGEKGDGNKASLNNDIWTGGDTGSNDADKNTSYDGDPTVWTGDSASVVNVSNSGNVNSYGSEMNPEWPSFDFNFNLSLNWADFMSWMANHH